MAKLKKEKLKVVFIHKLDKISSDRSAKEFSDGLRFFRGKNRLLGGLTSLDEWVDY